MDVTVIWHMCSIATSCDSLVILNQRFSKCGRNVCTEDLVFKLVLLTCSISDPRWNSTVLQFILNVDFVCKAEFGICNSLILIVEPILVFRVCSLLYL